jgi:DNA-binding response OmpR family regulator
MKFDVVPIAEVPKEDKISVEGKTRPVVLIVDDERVIADTLSIILSKSGFSTMTAYDGESALKLASANPLDLLLTDVMMPGMTGIELAITVTGTIPGCRVLLFSGQASTVDLLEKARHQGHSFTTLTKPVHPTDMLKRISECLGIQEPTFNELPPSVKADTPITALPN